ncbi:NAD/NADP octopine/nopaline dehydrogenase family protein [Halomonas sp. AOP12-C2-37]|uniref:NAD/NADP octopine/nopaline dehydrogenase family protein n=1 Tax=unclassified Halomonas TaxID=2609666 RepID=UPI0040347914
MNISILGAGPIGLTYCAMLLKDRHSIRLWSKEHAPSNPVRFDGLIKGEREIAVVETLDAAVANTDIIIFARRANDVQEMIDRILPLLSNNQVVVFSAELSMSAIYFQQSAKRMGKCIRCIAWSTTVATAQRVDDIVRVGTMRDLVDMRAFGFADQHAALSLCNAIFGPIFRIVNGDVAIGLSNLNPQIHLANGIANITRIEAGESWDNYRYITPVVGRLAEQLDYERLCLARALKVEVRDIFEHYLRTFPGIKSGSVSQMANQVYKKSPGTLGPTAMSTRYFTEDIPFGIVPLSMLGHIHDVAMPLHNAGIDLASAYCGLDFRNHNGMIATILSYITYSSEEFSS